MKRIIFALMFVLCISFAYAQPAIPTQVYGTVDKDVPDGTLIEFKIGEEVVASGTIKDNAYGYDPLIFIPRDDPFTTAIEGYSEGDTIDIYIAEKEVGETELEGDDVVEIDLTISESTQSSASSSGTGSSGTGSSSGGECEPTWECSDWDYCSAGIQTRVCIDKWDCGDESDKPDEIRECAEAEILDEAEPEIIMPPVYEEPREITVEETGGLGWVYIIIALIVLGGLGGLGFIIFEKKRAHLSLHQEKQHHKLEDQSMQRLQSYVKQTLEQGYTKAQVKQALLNEGWSPRLVNNVIKG